MPNVGRLMQAVALTELVAARFQLAEDLYMKSSDLQRSRGSRVRCACDGGLAFAQAAQENYIGAIGSHTGR